MTKAQWMFEFHALKKTDTMMFTALRKTMVNVMGLDMIRPADANGMPKKFAAMTEDELNSFIPLVLWNGHPEILKRVADQYADAAVIEQIDQDSQSSNSNAEYEAMVAAIDAAGGDMDPIISVDPNISSRRVNPQLLQQDKLSTQPIEVDLEGKA
jgi:hypothetical protein